MIAADTLPDTAIDFSRFAPERPRPVLIHINPDEPREQGELEQLLGVMRNALALLGLAVRAAIHLIYRRTVHAVERHVLQSLRSAWISAGLGWGGFIALCALQAW